MDLWRMVIWLVVMGCHPKPIDELIFFKIVKTTNQWYIVVTQLRIFMRDNLDSGVTSNEWGCTHWLLNIAMGNARCTDDLPWISYTKGDPVKLYWCVMTCRCGCVRQCLDGSGMLMDGLWISPMGMCMIMTQYCMDYGYIDILFDYWAYWHVGVYIIIMIMIIINNNNN